MRILGGNIFVNEHVWREPILDAYSWRDSFQMSLPGGNPFDRRRKPPMAKKGAENNVMVNMLRFFSAGASRRKSRRKFDQVKERPPTKNCTMYKDNIKKQNHQNIIEIRDVIKSYKNIGKIHLGGIPMIADDMMSFIKSDIIVFGLGVFLFIVGTLWYVFRKLIWVIVPISSCFFSVVIMMGLLGLLGWKVTVISSNFIALMLI